MRKQQKKGSEGNSKLIELTKNQKEFNDLFTRAVEARKKSCFWDEGDWEDRWELQNEYILPRQDVGDQSDGFRSKVKSPEIIARNQSTKQKLSKLNIGFNIRPTTKAAKLAAQIDQEILNYYFKEGLFRASLDSAFAGAIDNGTAFVGVEWLKKTRKVHLPVTDFEKMTPEQVESAKKDDKVPYTEAEMIDYRGPVLLHYELPDVFVDPTGINLQGNYRSCDFAFVAELVPFEKFKTEFTGKKGFKDVDKVKAVTSAHRTEEGAGETEDTFMHPPIDQDGEYVYLVKGWSYSGDWYMIRANNVFIKEDYLPYTDKKIPLEVLKPYSFPNQIYGIAPADLLIPTVYQMELMLNTLFDYAIYTSNPVLLVDKQDYGDFSRKYELVNGKPGSLLPVSNPAGSVSPLKFPQMVVDVYQGIEKLQRDAVIATQHDPSQLGFMQKDATATANIMNKEVVDNYIGSILYNFKLNLESIAKMVVSRIHQFMKRGDVDKIINGEGEVSPFEIPVVGKTMEIDWDERTVKIESDPNRVTVIKVSPEIYKYQDEEGNFIEVTPNDYAIQIDAESLEIVSKALEKQKTMEAFGQLMPYAVNPNNPEMAMQNPLGMIDATILFQEFVEKLDLNEKLLLIPGESEKKELQRAEEQNMQMFSGERAMGQAGESQAHVQHHVRFLRQLENLYEDMMDDIKNSIMAGTPPDPEMQQQFDKLRIAMPIISEHIDFDTTPVLAESQLVSSVAKAQTAPMPQPGIGQSVSQSGMGGSQAAPNVPKDAGMTQGGPGDMPSEEQMM
jgi:hypothetical protein